MNDGLVLRRVEVEGRPVDVHLADGLVAAVGPGLAVPSGTPELHGRGGALLPGLHDHHVHLLAMAARTAGLDLDPLPDASAVDRLLTNTSREVVARATTSRDVSGGGDWVRASGYDEHRHGPMDRYRLDALVGAVAIRVQHRSGLGWVLSTEGLRSAGLLGVEGSPPMWPDGVEVGGDGRLTGWLHRLDDWLGDRVPPARGDLAAVSRSLSGYGITGVTDATHALGLVRLAILRIARQVGELQQRLVLLGTGDDEAVQGWARIGPAKGLADEMLGLDPLAMTDWIRVVHAHGRPVAIHAVTRAENVAAVTALIEAGPLAGDRLEHGSVLPVDLDPLLVAGGVTVIVQPSLVYERGDHHLGQVEAEDLPFLHRHASLLAAGVRVGVGSDAPVTSADPWAGIVAASTRRTRTGGLVGSGEAVDPATALGWYLADPLDPGGPPRRVVVGAAADLCLLDGTMADALAEPTAERVRHTWVAGRLVYP